MVVVVVVLLLVCNQQSVRLAPAGGRWQEHLPNMVAGSRRAISLVEAELWPEAWDATLVHGREDEDDDGDPRHENGSLSEKEAQR